MSSSSITAKVLRPSGDPSGEPSAGSAETRLRALVRLAILAPSSHNTQPWLFRTTPDTVEVWADRRRALPVVDPHDRALVISCGAALGMLRVAIEGSGHSAIVTRLPEQERPDLLARVQLGAPREPTTSDVARVAAITQRRTNRQPFDGGQVTLDTLHKLEQVAQRDGVWLRSVITPDEKQAVARLVAAGDRAQAADPAFRRELSEWIHPNRSRSDDGMPGAAFGVGDLASVPFPWIIRRFHWGNGRAAKDEQLAAGSPALLVLGTEEDTPVAWLRAGEALALLLLDATGVGLSASFLNQPIEVERLRPELARTLAVRGWPQLLLRVGYGPHLLPTPRRPVEEVLIGDPVGADSVGIGGGDG